jgi:hypothetical protein
MKKIFTLVIFLTLLSCSKSSNDDLASNPIPAELIGTWKYTGYYDDIADANGNNFHLINENFLATFNIDGTVVLDYNNTITNGTYSVSSDSILICNHNSLTSVVLPFPMSSFKIFNLTNSIFKGYPVDSPIDYQFEKINTNPTISGK